MTWTPLDEDKHRAQVAMRRLADEAIRQSKAAIERSFTRAQAAMMEAGTSAGVGGAEFALAAAMNDFQGAIDALDR